MVRKMFLLFFRGEISSNLSEQMTKKLYQENCKKERMKFSNVVEIGAVQKLEFQMEKCANFVELQKSCIMIFY